MQRAQTDEGVPSTDPNIAWETLAENIEELQFEYMVDIASDVNAEDWKWTSHTAEMGNLLGLNPATKKELEQIYESIIAVKIVILGGARPASFSPTDPATYNPPLK